MDISFGGPILGTRGIGPLGSRRRSRASLLKSCLTAAEYTGTWGWAVTLGIPPRDAAGARTPAAGATATAAGVRGAGGGAGAGDGGPGAAVAQANGFPTAAAGHANGRRGGQGHGALSHGLSAFGSGASGHGQGASAFRARRSGRRLAPEVPIADSRDSGSGSRGAGRGPSGSGRSGRGSGGFGFGFGGPGGLGYGGAESDAFGTSGAADAADEPWCACGEPHCPAPGLHPLDPGIDPGGPKGEELPPGAGLSEAREAWAAAPGAPLLLPVGRGFDLLDVPEAAGHRALVRLERMGTRLGPVLATPTGRALFFVAPGAAGALPELLYKTGWDDAGLDLVGHGEGSYLAAPPTAVPGFGTARWLRPPTAENAHRVPEARLLLGTLAYACHRGHAPRPRDPRLPATGAPLAHWVAG